MLYKISFRYLMQYTFKKSDGAYTLIVEISFSASSSRVVQLTTVTCWLIIKVVLGLGIKIGALAFHYNLPMESAFPARMWPYYNTSRTRIKYYINTTLFF
jgi:hypothetical protein